MRGRRGGSHPPREERPALPAFDAVPRLKPRHDGWTPARQVAFIEALADTGSVKSAAAQVNMSTESAYALRRAPGAKGFTRAGEAALDMGVLRLKACLEPVERTRRSSAPSTACSSPSSPPASSSECRVNHAPRHG